MSYARNIERECIVPSCSKRATYEVFNQWNAPMGLFCRVHADRLVKTQGAHEDRERERHAVPTEEGRGE